MLAPPGESHDTYTQGDIDDDRDDIIERVPTNDWRDRPLVAHKIATTSFSLPSGSQHATDHSHSVGIDDFFGGQLTSIHPKHFEIEWIRIYKNPRITKLAKLRKDGAVVGRYNWRNWRSTDRSTDIPVNPVIKPSDFLPRRARIFPSLWADYDKLLKREVTLDEVEDDYFWVNINRNGELLPDDDKPGNSGLVTATENNTVVPGDRVAIAINVKLHYYKAVKDFINPAPGDDPRSLLRSPLLTPRVQLDPLFTNTVFTADDLSNRDTLWRESKSGSVEREVNWTEQFLPLLFKPDQKVHDSGTVWARNAKRKDIAGGTIIAAVGIQPVGILNPNYPLERITQDGTTDFLTVDSAVTAEEWGHPNADGYHTIVYQFTVTEAHVKGLNGLLPGGWLDGGPANVNPFNVAYLPGAGSNYEFADFNGTPSDIDKQHQAIRTYAEITALRELKDENHEQEFGFGVPFGANTANSGKRWADFMDATAFIAGAPYIPYPDISGAKRTEYRDHRIRHTTDDRPVPPAELVGKYKGVAGYYIEKGDLDRNDDGLLDYLPVIDDTVDFVSPTVRPTDPVELATLVQKENTRRDKNGRLDHYTVSTGFYRDHPETEFPHLFPPTYNTSKGRIYYPTVVQRVAAMTAIDVPSGPQTGTFTVTLRFQEDHGELGIFAPSHGPDVFTTLQAALSANVENGTVTGVSHLGVVVDAGRQYRVTVVPALGFKGEMTFQLPADTVVAANNGLGNLASAAVTVQVDTSLQLVSGQEVEVVEPEGDAYQTGDEIEVRVPFETDGLTFEGENPPYVTIYLGAQEAANARHATWQKGEEQSGSTVVPFAYVLQEADPSAESVSVVLNSLSIPRETTLMSGAGLERRGTDDPAVALGEVAPVPVSDPSTEPMISITDPSGERGGTVTVDPPAPVKPQVIYLPPDDTVSKAVASAVPLSPVVFNELGNGSDAANDWLEFRNVTGSDVSLKDWELSVIADGKKEDTSLIVFPDVSVPANGLLLITNMPSDKTPLAGGANKGLSHASLVDAGLSLPDDGKFLLILRNAKEKLGLDEAFIDVAGGGGSDTDAFVRDETGDYDTHVWPLQVLEAPGDATEDALSSGKVWQRAKSDIIGYHRDAWAEAAFTGIGYDRQVSKSAATAGTPGYPNGAVKTEAATPKGAVTISEIMFDSEGGTLPQWIELYNKSKTEALNLNRWQLEIQNRNSGDLIGRPIVTLTLQEKVIQPNQTLLIVAGDARASSADVFPEDRVYNLLELHEKNLRIKTARDTFLSGEGFYLKLSDRNGTKIDEVGNIDDNRRTDDAPVWVWPTNRRDGARSSVVRRYDKGADARDGMLKSNWALAAHFNKFKVESLHYGHADDIGTPGYRKGGALPVELSSFTLTRTDAGPVVVTWTTESEVDNAGFNLRRSLKRDSGFTLLNPVLIAGAGTTGERQTYTFTDTSAKPGVEYYYQIEEVSLGGRPEVLRTRYLPGPVSPANRSLTTFGEVKQRE